MPRVPAWMRVQAVAWMTALASAAPLAQAGLFDDNEARRAILELRQQMEQSDARAQAQAQTQAQLLEQIGQLRRSLLDLNSQLDTMRAELAQLRGQDEQLTRDVAELQRQQKAVQTGVEERIRQLEPQKVVSDGREFLAQPEETRQFEDSIAVLRTGDFAAAASAFGAFLRRYPNSGYKPSALYWQGNALYGMRDYKQAMAAFHAVTAADPTFVRAPESMLAIANCQMELKDTRGARKTIDDLVKAYPDSEAAQAGKARLASLK